MSKRSSKKSNRKSNKKSNKQSSDEKTVVLADWNSAGEEFKGITRQEALDATFSMCAPGGLISFIFNREVEIIDFDTKKVLHKWLILDNENTVQLF